jgi:hypothetical protein
VQVAAFPCHDLITRQLLLEGLLQVFSGLVKEIIMPLVGNKRHPGDDLPRLGPQESRHINVRIAVEPFQEFALLNIIPVNLLLILAEIGGHVEIVVIEGEEKRL